MASSWPPIPRRGIFGLAMARLRSPAGASLRSSHWLPSTSPSATRHEGLHPSIIYCRFRFITPKPANLALDFSSKGSMHGRAVKAAGAAWWAARIRFRACLGGGAGLSGGPEPRRRICPPRSQIKAKFQNVTFCSNCCAATTGPRLSRCRR